MAKRLLHAAGNRRQGIDGAMASFDFFAPVPCLLIKRRTYDEEGRMIEYVEGLVSWGYVCGIG